MIIINILKLAFKNIRRNLYEYVIFITTLTLSVTILFSFLSFSDNSSILANYPKLEHITIFLKLASGFISIFLIIFIWYCNSFFITKRKKDVAIYLILGMRKYQIALMFFFELTLIGFLSISLGIFLGILFLKLFWMFILSLEGLNTSLINFYIPFSSIRETIKVFSILFVILGLFTYIKLWRKKIIGMLNKKLPKPKKTIFLIIFSLISLVMMFFGYKLAITSSMGTFLQDMIIAVLLVLVGTYLFFSSTLTMYIKLKRKNKFIYYRDLNMFTYSNLESKIRENCKSLATITILLTTALIIITTIANFFVKINQYKGYDESYTISYISKDKNNKTVLLDYIKKDLNLNIASLTEVPSLKTNIISHSFSSLDDYVGEHEIRIISYSSLINLNKNSYINQSLPKSPKLDECIYVIKPSDFNPNLVRGFKPIKFISLNEDIKVSRFVPNSFIPPGLIANFLVVNDITFNKLQIIHGSNLLQCVQINYNGSRFLDINSSTKLFRDFNINERTLSVLDEYTDFNYKAFSYAIFTGLIVAIVLLMCTGNVIFFKQLSNAEDAKESYRLLKTLGVEKPLIRKTIRKESFMIFALPLFMSIFHSFAALTMFRKTMFSENLLPTILSVLLFVFVYLIYYVLTIDIYFKIIDKES